MKHFPRKGTGTDLVAICDRYTAESIGDVGDERRDRFTTDESVIFDPETGCAYCRETLIAASAHHVQPQVWEHPEIEARSRRGEELERPAFATWRSAVRVLTAIRDEGAGVKSSSDPSRFEALPVGTAETPEGDRAQREAGRLAWVARALDGAFVAPFTVTTFPVRLTLHAMLCREILIGRVVGRAVQACPVLGCEGGSRCDKRKHRRVLSRREWPAAELGEHVSEAMRVSAEWPAGMITAGIVNAITAEGGRAIEADLMRRGLISHCDAGLRREERSMAIDKGRLLIGWKSISQHLGEEDWSVKRCMGARGWVPPIPAREVGGRIEADADELDAWRAAGPRLPKDEDAA